MNQNTLLSPKVKKRFFGELTTGEAVECYTLTNENNLTIEILPYGAIIRSITLPNNRGDLIDIVLGYDDIQGYEKDPYYLGAMIGRYAGRIAEGKLTIDDKHYQLTQNTPVGQLHGGKQALNKQLWQAETVQNENSISLVLVHVSPDGDNGFPGDVEFKVIYTLASDNSFTMEYFASTNQPTLVNLTQHSYFNLAGHQHGDISRHQLTLTAEHFLPMTPEVFPTGEIASVQDTPYDFNQAKAVGKDLTSKHPQIVIGKGFDNYWLNRADAMSGETFTAHVKEPNSGLSLTLYTDQPCIIFYSANYIDGSQIGKASCRYQEKSALCLEPQRAYDFSLTDDDFVPFASSILRPEQPFYSKTVWKFSNE